MTIWLAIIAVNIATTAINIIAIREARAARHWSNLATANSTLAVACSRITTARLTGRDIAQAEQAMERAKADVAEAKSQLPRRDRLRLADKGITWL